VDLVKIFEGAFIMKRLSLPFVVTVSLSVAMVSIGVAPIYSSLEPAMAGQTESTLGTPKESGKAVDPVTPDKGWAGKWQSAADARTTITLSATGKTLRGTQNRAISRGSYARTELKNFRVISPSRVTCDGTGTYVDPEKTITCLSSFGLILSGDSIAVTHTGLDRKFKWKPGVPPNEQSCTICVPKLTIRDTYTRVK
jgi:hypothetical protein